MDKTCFFSGHRNISAQERARIIPYIEHFVKELVYDYGVTRFISGGAIGFDTICAKTVLAMQDNDREFAEKVQLSLYLPCYDQDAKWSIEDKFQLQMLKFKAADYRYITESNYTSDCMRRRNFAMVDAAKYGIVFCNYDRSGTAQTTRYAKQMNRNFVNLALVLQKDDNKMS